MGTLASFLRKYTRECILAPLFKLFEALLELFVPLVVASIVDDAIPQGDRGLIMQMVLILFALAAAGLIVSFTAQYFSAKAAACFARDAKKALFAHIQTFSLADCDRTGLATLINRMTGDMNQVQSGVNMTLRLLLRSPFVVFGAALMAFTVDVRAALIFVVAIPLLSMIVYVLLRISVPRFRTVQSHSDGLLAQTRENYKGARVIRAFSLQDREVASFTKANGKLLTSQLRAGRISVLTNPMTSFVVNTAIIAIIYYGGLRVDTGTLSQGSVVALFNYMSQILVELIKLASLIQTITKALASARRVEAVFDSTSSMAGGSVSEIDDSCDTAIEFRNVSFSYNDSSENVLTDISFSLRKGQTLGIIGATGSGKSTLAALIARLYDVKSGEVDIFGRNVRDYSLSFLHSNVTLALQKARLFKGTIRENMLLADPDAGEEDILAALKDASAYDFVMQKGLDSPVEAGGRNFSGGQRQGLDSPVEAGGRNFSGGQRQRLSIARSLVHGGRILILDDSFSALDYMTDSAVRTALAKRDLTKVIISQRTSSILNADKIILLENGCISAMGTHEELLATSSIYQDIYYTQFEKEEKADV